MVSQDIAAMYDKMIEYSKSKGGYFKDPSSAPGELSDFLEGVDLNDAVKAIQMLIVKSPSLREASLIKSFRDMRSMQAENDIRMMSRADYFKDAYVEETDNGNKWTYNKKIRNLQMTGKGEGA